MTAQFPHRIPFSRNTAARIFLPAFVLLALMSTLWGLASPIFSSPDENAHAAKAIAQIHGEVIGHREKGVPNLVVTLPRDYSYSPNLMCFVYQPGRAADCGVQLGDPGGDEHFATWVGAYNPVYYEIVAWPTLFLGSSTGIYAMRIVSALLSAAILAFAFQAAFAARRVRWMAAGVAFLAAPMVIYMAGSVTPQGLEIASGAAMWIGLIRLLETFDPARETPLLSRRYLWMIVSIAASFLAVARATGPLWVVVVAAVCLLIIGWTATKRLFTTRWSYLPLSIIAAAGIFSVVWTLTGGSLSGQAKASESPGAGRNFVFGAWETVRNTPRFIQESAGVFGWLDTQLPLFVYVLFFSALVLLVTLAVTGTHRRGLLSVGLVVVVSLAVPILVQGYSVHQTGLIWQGRYGLFLYVGVPLVSAWILSGRLGERLAFMSVRVTIIIAVLLGVYGILAFLLALRRYVIGVDTPITHLLSDPKWEPPFGWLPLTIVFALVMALYTTWIIRLALVSAREPLQAEGTIATVPSRT